MAQFCAVCGDGPVYREHVRGNNWSLRRLFLCRPFWQYGVVGAMGASCARSQEGARSIRDQKSCSGCCGLQEFSRYGLIAWQEVCGADRTGRCRAILSRDFRWLHDPSLMFRISFPPPQISHWYRMIFPLAERRAVPRHSGSGPVCGERIWSNIWSLWRLFLRRPFWQYGVSSHRLPLLACNAKRRRSAAGIVTD